MPRPRTFDEKEVITRAMLAFWKKGYGATSIRELEDATGISRISIYNAFRDKEGLFLAALRNYHQIAHAFLNEDFIAGGLDSIVALFESMAKRRPKDAPEHFGCLMVNSILDVHGISAEAHQIVMHCRKDLLSAFTSALRQARRDGEIDATDREIKDRAEFLVAVMWGCRTTSRLAGDALAGRGIAKTAAAMACGWRV
ncbi:MAG: TetR/AcrR family transcriptional regulator [Myxococcota bacterium]